MNLIFVSFYTVGRNILPSVGVDKSLQQTAVQVEYLDGSNEKKDLAHLSQKNMACNRLS